jgi:hypothetical protein
METTKSALERQLSHAISNAEQVHAETAARRETEMRGGVEEEDQAAREDGMKW